MRSVLAISLPEERKEKVSKLAKKAQKSTSAYVLMALDLMESLISEEELVKRSQEAEKNYKRGKTKPLRSLADLME